MEQFLAIVFGAIISAFIGVLSVYFGGKIHEQKWRKENIYKPLYNEISCLVTAKWTGLPHSLSTKWTTIDNYSKLITEKQLRSDLNMYENKILEYGQMSKDYEKTLDKHLSNLEDTIRKAFSPKLISPDKKSIILEKHDGGSASIEIKSWIKLFREPLLTSKNGKDLYKNLINSSGPTGHEKYIRKWFSEHPEIFDNLIKEYSTIRSSLEHETIYRKMDEKLSDITTRANKLKIKLERMIKKMW